jgi:hypothetical protein
MSGNERISGNLLNAAALPQFYPQPYPLTLNQSEASDSSVWSPAMNILSFFVTNPSIYKVPKPLGVKTIPLPPEQTLELRELILGKAPLRLITARIPSLDDPNLFLETLECGHQLYSFQNFEWNHGLNWLPMKSLRRRCQKCKEVLAKKKPVASAELSAERKIG